MNKIKKNKNPDCTLTLVLLLKWKKVFLKGWMGVLGGRVWIRGSHSEDHPDELMNSTAKYTRWHGARFVLLRWVFVI